jgi:hypothetical protein
MRSSHEVADQRRDDGGDHDLRGGWRELSDLLQELQSQFGGSR